MMITFYGANQLTTVGNAVVLQYCSTAFVVMYQAVDERRLPEAVRVGVVLLALVGMVLFFFDELTVDGIVGNALAIVSGAFFGLMFYLNSKLGAAPLCSSMVGWTLAVVVGLAAVPSLPQVAPEEWGSMVVQSLVCTCLASVLFAYGIVRVPALSANMICMSEVVLAPLWAYLLFGEAFGRFAFLGAALIVASIILNLLVDRHTSKRLAMC